MSKNNGYHSDEEAFMARDLNQEEVESLLAGGVPDNRPDLAMLAEEIGILRSALVVDPPGDVRDRHVAAAIAAVLEAPEVVQVERRTPARSRLRLGRVAPGLAIKILVGASLALALGTGAAAAGILPDPIQQAFANVATIVGIELPRPTTTTTAVTMREEPEPADSSTTTTTTVPAEDTSTTTATVPLPPPTAVLTMSSDPGSVDEPGGVVVFAVELANATGRSIEVTALTDEMFGDLLDPRNENVTANTCAGDQILLAADESFSCTFEALVSGRGGDPDYATNTTVRFADSHGFESTVAASVVVAFNDVDPVVALDVTPSVATLPESGGDLTVAVTITNMSEERVTLTSLVDDVFGDLLDPNNTQLVDNTCPALAGSHGAGATMTCSFDVTVVGDAAAGSSRYSTRVQVVDRRSNRGSASTVFSIGFEDVRPAVTASLSSSAIALPDPGGPVLFTVVVTNQSVEPVNMAFLFDITFGNLLSPANSSSTVNSCPSYAGSWIPAGGVLTCAFQEPVAGHAGDVSFEGEVVVRAFDNEGNPATATSTVRVGFTVAGTTVGGVVFTDLDGDGIRDAGEGGLPGVWLNLVVPGIGSTTATTGADGSWSASVLPGSVTVSVVSGSVPSGLGVTTGNESQTVTAQAGVAVSVGSIGYRPGP